MKTIIEKILREKIGTSFVHDDSRDIKLFKLNKYGQDVMIVYDEVVLDKKFTKVIYPEREIFTVIVEQGIKNFEKQLVASIKMMIELRKRE